MKRLTDHLPRPATLVALVIIGLTAATGATAATLVTGKQIRDNSVTGADIKRGTLGASDLSRAARRSLRGATGKTGPAGSPGPRGEPGVTLADRVFAARADDVEVEAADSVKQIVELLLPGGRFVIDANLSVKSDGSGDVCSLRTSDGLLHELQFTIGDQDGDQVILQGEFDNSSRQTGRVRVSCSADDRLQVTEARMRAVEVGSLG